MGKRSLFAELKRRHVYRVAVAYGVVGWLLIEVATQVFPVFHMPDWTAQLVVMLVLLGFPVALVLAWAFEITPEGVRRTEPVESPEARGPEQHRQVGRKLDLVIIGVLVVAVALLAWRPWSSHKVAPPPAAASVAASPKAKPGAPAAAAPSPASITHPVSKKSIAVLPFENLSADKDNKYFADGMQDLILTKLADIGDLTVISRTSTARYASHPVDLKTIAEQLGVANILEGSVQKAGNSVLINVQLIAARTDAHIWAQAYTRTLDNVFGVEGEVAEKIADALKAKLSPADTKRLATALSGDPQANDLYLHAEYLVNQAGVGASVTSPLKKAIPLYRQAIARVPDFALAHARLSYAESWLSFNGGGGEDVRQLDADARAQAEQAMKLAPDLAESHLAVGYCDYYGKGDYDGALKAFAAALQLRPNDADALAARGYVLRRQGKYNEAIDAEQKALALDPRNGVMAVNLIETFMAIGRYAEAEQLSRQALAVNPGNDSARINYVISIIFRTGDPDRALAAAQGNSDSMKAIRVHLLTLKRDYPAAIALLESIPDTADDFRPKAYKDIWLGNLYRLSGDLARARAHYTKALPEFRASLPAVAKHPLEVAQMWNSIADAEVGLGKTAAAMAAIKASLAAAGKSADHFGSLSVLVGNAITYAKIGRAEAAVSLLDRVLSSPGSGEALPPTLLWRVPDLDPIHKSPAFRALLKKYAKYRPVAEPATAAK